MKKVLRAGIALVFAACLGLNVVPAMASGTEGMPYNMTYEEYATYVDDFSYIEEKDTTSSIGVENYTCNQPYHVIAYGSYSPEQGSYLSDCSDGGRLAVYFSEGGYQYGELGNYVVELGFCATAIRGIYNGDNYFHAEGWFTPDI